MKKFLILLTLIICISICSYGLQSDVFLSKKNVEDIVLENVNQAQFELIIKDIKIIKNEKIGDMEIVYGFSTEYDDYYFLEGKKANIQLVYSGQKLIIGSPIIYSGY